MRNPFTVGALALVLSLACAARLAAGPLEDAAEAALHGDYESALRLWRPLADQGNAAAQAHLAGSYKFGLGVQQDDTEAAKWFRKAADQGYPVAQWSLGLMYANGDGGLPQDYAQAVTWYRKAADQGLAGAQGNLGQMYAKGQGVPQDYAAAAAWYRKSADQGLAISQNNLGTMYVSGQGVTRDYVQAHKWFNLAAERFTPSVIEGREFAVKNRDAVAAMMTSARGSAEARTRVGTKIRKLWAGNGPLHDLQEAGRSARPGSHIPERIGFQYAGKCQPLQINAP